MSQLAFYPWFTTQSEISVGPVRLVRYERGRGPVSGAEQAAIDNVLEPYKQQHNMPIQACTIVTIGDRGLTDDFSEQQLDDLFRYGEAIALGGLSRRKYFDHFSYANRDNFRLVVQGFTEPAGGVLVISRRRDGGRNMHFTRGTYRVICPHHVSPGAYDLDAQLIEATLAAESDEDWPQIFQAMLLFNEANTDRDNLPEAAELVLSFAALEQLLDVPPNNRALANRFDAEWRPLESLPKPAWQVAPSSPSGRARLECASTLRSAWMDDLAITRGSLAHGHGIGAYPSIWSPQEHLLFTAFAVPLLVKIRLGKRGHYTLTDEDLAGIDALEQLLNTRHFDGRVTGATAQWSRIIGTARMHRWVLKAAEEALEPGDSSD